MFFESRLCLVLLRQSRWSLLANETAAAAATKQLLLESGLYFLPRQSLLATGTAAELRLLLLLNTCSGNAGGDLGALGRERRLIICVRGKTLLWRMKAFQGGVISLRFKPSALEELIIV